jgi:hypothetical protein
MVGSPPFCDVPVGRREGQLLEWCGRASGKMLGPRIGRAVENQLDAIEDKRSR